MTGQRPGGSAPQQQSTDGLGTETCAESTSGYYALAATPLPAQDTAADAPRYRLCGPAMGLPASGPA